MEHSCAPYYSLRVLDVHGFKNGAIVADLLCPVCGRVWHNVQTSDIARGSGYCSDCELATKEAWRLAELVWPRFNYYRSSNTGQLGMYGLRDDILYHITGRAQLPPVAAKKAGTDLPAFGSAISG